MLHSVSIRSYLNRWGLKNFKNVILFTNNDDAYLTAIDLISHGIKVNALIDTRRNPKFFDSRIKVYKVLKVIDTKGKLAIKGVYVLNEDGRIIYLKCNTLGVSGGWNPNIQLSCHAGVKPLWKENFCIYSWKK